MSTRMSRLRDYYSVSSLDRFGIEPIYHASARRALDTVDVHQYTSEVEFLEIVKGKLRVFSVLSRRLRDFNQATLCPYGGGRRRPLGNTRCPHCDCYHPTGVR